MSPRLGVALTAAAALGAGAAGSSAVADSFHPVSLTIAVAPVARLHKPLKITVTVNADPGALDNRSGAIRMRVRLSAECGGSFDTTPGTVLVDQRLEPQPATGHAYRVVTSGSGRPADYGTMAVCVYLEDEGAMREWATDQSGQVDVSQPCTMAAARYDRARKQLARARRHHRNVARARRRVKTTRRRAAHACGPGVPL